MNPSLQGAVAGASSFTPVEATKRPGISDLLKDLDGEISAAAELLARAQEITDRLIGTQPRAVQAGNDIHLQQELPEPGAIVDRLRARRQRLSTILDQLGTELCRIQGAL